MPPRTSHDTNLIKTLELFVAIAETGQVTKAAQLLGVTQSAASQHLASLEASYDVALFDRKSRPLTLTQAGQLLFRHAQKILGSVEDLASSMRHEGPQSISVLRVGVLASIATTLTPPLVSLAKTNFGVEDLTLHAGISEDHDALLRTKRADVVITSDPFYDMDGLERHPVLQEKFLLVLPQDYRGPTKSISDILEHLPLVRFAGSTSVGRRTEQHLRRLKLFAPRVIQADRSSMVTACVAQGLGFTILTPSLLIDGFVEKMPLRLKPLPSAEFSRSITVVARENELGSLPSDLARLARDTLVQQIDRQMGVIGLDALNTDPEITPSV